MTRTEPRRANCPEQLEILTFRLRGILMGADVEQLREVTPKLLVLRGPEETVEMRVAEIDRPDDIVTVPVGSIQAMPALIAACVGARPFWGTVIRDGSPIFLVDLDELTPPVQPAYRRT